MSETQSSAVARTGHVAIVGRPNVGKSTLFNVLTGTRDALVADVPGVTRDRKYGFGRASGRRFIVIDTGGLIETPRGLRIYGAGISSSSEESKFALEDPSPNRIRFDLERVMRTDYRIDDFQQTYFVIQSYDELFRATVDTDFAPLYARLADGIRHAPETVLPEDRLVTRGTQAYATARAGG